MLAFSILYFALSNKKSFNFQNKPNFYFHARNRVNLYSKFLKPEESMESRHFRTGQKNISNISFVLS